MPDDSSGMRRHLVEQLRRRGHLRDGRISAAFTAVPRETFLPDHAARYGLADVYRDEAIVTRRDPVTGTPQSSSSQPAIMAEMLEMLQVAPGQAVLEIGAGTGYNAALLDQLAGPAGHVTSVELDPEVAAQARQALQRAGAGTRVVVGDGRAGHADAAPFDAVVATASSETVPRAWHHQMNRGARLVLPLRLSPVVFSIQAVVALRKVTTGFDSVAVTSGSFMALRPPPSEVAPAALGARVVAGEVAAGQAPLAAGGAGSASAAASDGQVDPDTALIDLSGPALAPFGWRDRQRLVVTALGFGRSSPVDLGSATPWALASFLALALPPERVVQCTQARPPGEAPQALGVLDPLDGSLALAVVAASGVRCEAHGGVGAERVLVQTIDRWIGLGRPAVDRLSVAVRYGPERPHAWRSVRRDDQWIAFDWH